MNAYFADRQADGINSVLVQIICGQYTGNQNSDSDNYATYDGITPFTTDGDISTPNPAYFSRMQSMVQLAESHGITLFMDPADTGQLLDSSSFLADNGSAVIITMGSFLGILSRASRILCGRAAMTMTSGVPQMTHMY